MATRQRHALLFLLCFALLCARIECGLGQDFDHESATNSRRISAIDGEAAPVAARLRHVQSLIDDHNSRPVDRRDAAAVEAYNVRSDELNREKQRLVAKLKALKEEQDRLTARNREIAVHSEAVVRREQADFDRMNEHWLKAQQQLIAESVRTDLAWRQAVLNSLSRIEVPSPAQRPRRMSDLLPGDILLFAPEPGWNQAVPPADYIYRVASDLARGEAFIAMNRSAAPASHALTYVKQVNGVHLFLDHTIEGSRILDRRELARKYRDRAIYVARPEMAVDGQRLWAAAREAALRNKPYFGVLPGQLVCSEQACVAVSKATGARLQEHRLGPIDVTPGDFFDPAALGKYFIVSPLEDKANSTTDR